MVLGYNRVPQITILSDFTQIVEILYESDLVQIIQRILQQPQIVENNHIYIVFIQITQTTHFMIEDH